MDNRNAPQRPAASRLFDNGRQRFFGHSRIVLQRQRFYAVAEIMITHFPGKGHDRAVFVAPGQPVIFRAHVKTLMANQNSGFRHLNPL